MNKILRFIKSLLNFIIKIFQLIFRISKKVFHRINSKKRYAILFYGLLLFAIYIIVLILLSGDKNYNKSLQNKYINDITQLNPIQVNKIIKPKTINEIVVAIQTTTGPISIGGGKYSMGGQTAFENSLHIDMRSFNQVIKLDTVKKQVTVQAGIRWRDLQKIIDPHNLSIKIMQTYSNFTVGGAISVNCHGRYIGHGPIISSVIALKIITASGEIIDASREKNQEIFRAAIGGYGGIGVIAEATLQLTENTKVERANTVLNIEDYNSYFNKNIRNNKDVVFQNGDLYPPNYDRIRSVFWKKSSKELTDLDRLQPENEKYWLEANLATLVSWGNSGKWIRKNIIDPIFFSSEIVRWRNKEASYDVKELEPTSREEETYVLEEYFIPVENINTFIPKMKDIFQKYNVNVMNVSLRHALPDNESYLSWANKEVFAFVVYYKQKTDKIAKDGVKNWTVAMTNAILSEHGTWYLPYQTHASIEQFEKGYPKSKYYFDLKNKLDPKQRFTNKLLDKYNPYSLDKLMHYKNDIKGYYRAEEQTILTVPEWYLVFNPKEYADFLESGKNPSDFPFYQSIDEFWKLYDRSLKLVSNAYPENNEYKIMLQVIGVSLTMEYGFKMVYENTMGRLFSFLTEKEISKNEKVIIAAQRDYSNFIYQKAWYEFKFLPWISKVWNTKNDNNCSTIRKWERTLFFTFEYSFKAFYAQMIQCAANASYEKPETSIFLIVSNNPILKKNKDIKILKEDSNKMIISITRWGVFTEVLKKLASQNITIYEISGNDEIVISVIKNKENQIIYNEQGLLYQSNIVSNDKQIRDVYILNVNKLLPFIKNTNSKNETIEHIFDY